MRKKQTLHGKISERIAHRKANVFIREDFDDLGGYDQIGRILAKLVTEGRIMRIGYGLYAKAKVSSLSGKLLPVVALPNLGKEALRRLKVRTVPTKAEIEYNEGRSTQVPTGRSIAVRGRFSRKIGYNGIYLTYEDAT